MRIYLNSVVLAALAAPAMSFHVVMMSNYLDKIGGGGGKPMKKAPWSPQKGSGPSPQEEQPTPPPAQIPMAMPPEQSAQPDGSDEPVMAAMNELTDTFVKNEAATLLALKEISSSMKILAEQGRLGGASTGQAAQQPPPQPADPQPAPLPPPPPAQEMAAEPVPQAPASEPSPSSTPIEEFSGSSAWGSISTSGGSYLENIGGGSSAPPKPASFLPKRNVKPKDVSAGPGSYLDSVAGQAPSGTKSYEASAPPPQPPAKAASPPPEKAAPSTPEKAASSPPAKADPSQPVSKAEPPAPPAATSAPPPPAPAPPSDPEPLDKSNVGANLGLTFAGLGLLFALAGGGGDYIQSLKLSDFSSGLSDTLSSFPEAISSEKADVPSSKAPGAVVEESQIPVPGSQAPVQGIYDKIMGTTDSGKTEKAEEAPPKPETPAAPKPEAAAPKPEAPAAPKPEAAAPKPEAPAAPKPEAAAPKPEAPTTPKPEAAAPKPEAATPKPEAVATPPPPPAKEVKPQSPPVATSPPAAKAPEAKKAPVVPPSPPAPTVPGGAAAGAVGAGAAASTAAAGAASALPSMPAKNIGSTYSYDPASSNGPYGWSNLDIEGNQCGGKKQSPIAITPSGCNVGGNYKMEANTKCSVSDLDYSLGRGGPKASFPKQCGGTTIKIPVLEGIYEAVQFHTHIGSEHVLGGKRAGAELHIVHKEQGGNRFAVVGIMINGDGAVDNPTFGRLLDKWSAVENKVAADCNGVVTPTKNRPFVSSSAFNVYDLVPLGSSFYHYDGSLTTPPCSEVVWWEVADTPLSVSPEQYDRLVKMTTTYTDPKTCEIQTAASPYDGTTNRPVAQDLSDRMVQRVCPTGDAAGAQQLVSSVGSSPTLAEAIPAPAQGQKAPTLLAQQFGDDDDPYRGL